MATQSIDWNWLRQTPAGTWGQLPGVGLTWYHPHRTAMHAEVVTVDLGDEAVTRPMKGRARPYQHVWGQQSRAEIRQRCPNRLAQRH